MRIINIPYLHKKYGDLINEYLRCAEPGCYDEYSLFELITDIDNRCLEEESK